MSNDISKEESARSSASAGGYSAGRMVSRLLRRNISGARIAGFALSDFIGLLIVCGALMLYVDSRPLWDDEESFIRTDYLVINKRVTSANTLGERESAFTAGEIADLESQPWVRKVGKFTSSAYRVQGAVEAGGRGMYTALFFESIPDRFVDAASSQWHWREGDAEVPVIISRDYLTLYNFGFASAAGLPQMSEGMMSGIPMRLTLSSEDGTRSFVTAGRVVGYSDRLNTILVPQTFMDHANDTLAGGADHAPSRLIVDVSSPGDVAIDRYLEEHDLQRAGDKGSSSAAFLLRTAAGTVMGIGLLVTLLSFFILLLSISLLMEKNRDRLYTLLLLGCPLAVAARPYRRVVMAGCVAAWALTVVALLCLRATYQSILSAFGEIGPGLWWGIGAATVLTLLVITGNFLSIRRRVESAWGLKRQTK